MARWMLILGLWLAATPAWADAKEQINALTRGWIAAYQERNLHALVPYYRTDAVMYPQGQPMRRGATEIRQYFAPIFAVRAPRKNLRAKDLRVEGATATQVMTFMVEDPGSKRRSFGRELWVLRQGINGQWRIVATLDNFGPAD
jgi:uncharacterized protein (TIGR02246 family)